MQYSLRVVTQNDFSTHKINAEDHDIAEAKAKKIIKLIGGCVFARLVEGDDPINALQHIAQWKGGRRD